MENQLIFSTAAFHNKFTLFNVKPNIYIRKTKFASHKQYLFRLLTSRNTKMTQADQGTPHVLFILSEKERPKNL